MSDGLVTWHDVAGWLPADVRDELLRALPPEARGWWTQAEADADGGRFLEATNLEHAEPRYFRVGGPVRFPHLPPIVSITAPTTAELHAGVRP